jgi:ferredoxin
MVYLVQGLKAYDRSMGLEVEIDREVCMGSGNCIYEAPGVFDLDDDGVAVVIDLVGSPEDKVMAAERKCPTHAITVRRNDVTSP